MAQLRSGLFVILGCAGICACTPKQDAPAHPPESEAASAPTPTEDAPRVVLESPVAFWKDGATRGEVDAAKADVNGHLLLDLGEDWTPYLFTTSSGPDQEPKPMAYRDTYLALARGEYPKNRHGERARKDKYLELYGILPTFSLLRERFERVRGLECAASLDLDPLQTFEGFLAYTPGRKPARRLARYQQLGPELEALSAQLGVSSVDEIEPTQLPEEDAEKVEEYKALAPQIEAIVAAQARLDCEGFFDGRGAYTPGLFDWKTHEALAEFERRHRVYGWGFIGKDTLAELQKTPEEAEQEAVIRVLTERAMHAAGVLEDGSTSVQRSGEPRTFKTEDGEELAIPDFETELRERVIDAFGLETPESTFAWLESLGEIAPQEVVALQGVELPPYYSDDMELHVTINRGDVWYEFPIGENGKARSQPVSRRPHLIVFVKYNGQKIPLARYGTTIGGWRGEFIDGTVMWKYKDSPVGRRVWSRIAAAPVWVPPESTPPKVLLTKNRKGKLVVNYHDTGPSYASAYGLVAAYHRKFYRSPDGQVQVGGDEGIRTHGSVDYMSIMRRHSHGCHRMHNHIAVRLMSFVLEHRRHTRYGHQPMVFRREFEFEDDTYLLEFDQGGYNFVLERPLPIDVVIGRVRGQVKQPIEHHLPRYDKEAEAFVMPDGQWVYVDRFGAMTPRMQPFDFDAPLEAPELGPSLEDLTAQAPGGEDAPASSGEGALPSAPTTSEEPPATPTPTAPPATTPINTSVVPLGPPSSSP